MGSFRLCCILGCFLIVISGAKRNLQMETWIQIDDLFKISVGMTSSEVIAVLGEPLFIEMENNDEIIIKKIYYNFRTKEYIQDGLKKKIIPDNESVNAWGRKTSIQFLFIDDRLTEWEEDKLTFSMAIKEKPKPVGFALSLLGLLLNIIIIVQLL